MLQFQEVKIYRDDQCTKDGIKDVLQELKELAASNEQAQGENLCLGIAWIGHKIDPIYESQEAILNALDFQEPPADKEGRQFK